MTITQSALQNKIHLAILNAGGTWSKQQESVLNELAQNNTLLGLPTMFKAAAWLNTGLGATKTLFPASALAGAIARLSIPIAVTSYAMDGFRSAYEGELRRANALLANDYQNIKDELLNRIRQAPHDLGNTPLGRNLAATVYRAVAHRAAEFVDEAQAYSHCYNMVKHPEHGLIETDITAIRRRSAEGFVTLCDKIYNVYRGSRGHNTLMHVDPGTHVCYRNIWAQGQPPVQRTDPFTNRTANCGPELELLARGNIKQREQIVKLLANIANYDVMHLKGWIEDQVYVRPGSQSASLEQVTESYARNDVADVFESMKKADQTEWPRTMGVMMGTSA